MQYASCMSDYIAVASHSYNASLLEGGRAFEAVCVDSSEQVLMQTHGVKVEHWEAGQGRRSWFLLLHNPL